MTNNAAVTPIYKRRLKQKKPGLIGKLISEVPSDLDVRLARKLAVTASEPTGNPHLFPWVVWYLKSEKPVQGSELTRDAKEHDLQMLVSYFYHVEPSGLIERWTKIISVELFHQMEISKYSISSRRRVHATIATFARWMGVMGIYTYKTDPMRGVKAVKAEDPKPQSLRLVSRHGEVLAEGLPVFEMLLGVAKSAISANRDPLSRVRPLRDFAMLTVLHTTGMRVSELCGLVAGQMRRFSVGGHEIGAFWDGVYGKGGAKRVVFMRMSGVDAVQAYLDEERTNAKTDFLFTSWHGKTGLSRSDVWKLIRRLCNIANANLPDGQRILAHPHSFRHERAYAMLNAGTLVTDAAKELGHSGLGQLKRYANRSELTLAQQLKDV